MENLIYVNLMGKNADDEFLYEFYFSDDIEMVWDIDWDVKPAVICNLSVPQKVNYNTIKLLKTNILLNVSQKNSCFSMQDCRDGIIPVAWEDIDGYDEYPDGRIVLPFGIEMGELENKLSIRSLAFETEN